MRMCAQVVTIVSSAALLQACLTFRPDGPTAPPPDSEQAATKTGTATANPAPATTPRKAAINVAAATKPASTGELLINGLKVDHNAIEILASGQIRDYSVITLSEPSRLVVNIPHATHGFTQESIRINRLGIASARFENRTDALRVHLEADQWRIIPYRVEETDTGLRIIITTP